MRLATTVLFLNLVFVASSIFAAHPNHATYTEAEWNANAKKIEMAIRIWPNDAESAFADRVSDKFRIDDLGKDPKIEANLKEYVLKSLSLSRDSKQLELQWVGAELNDKALWVYLESAEAEGWEGLSISNKLLFDVKLAEHNDIIWKVGKRTQVISLTPAKSSSELKFETDKPKEQ